MIIAMLIVVFSIWMIIETTGIIKNTKKMNKFKLTYGQVAYWSSVVWREHEKNGLRYGQSFYVHFHEFRDIPDEPFPELFYETDEDKAREIIVKNTEYVVE